MDIQAAQREVRATYLGGLPGLLISSIVWFVSAALGTWISWTAAMWSLIAGGAMIFVGLEFVLRATHRNPSLSPGNPLNPLLLQAAFLLPFLLPLIVGSYLYRADWLFPAFMIALGAHFLPFMFLFGTWIFGALGIVLFCSGLLFALAGTEHFAIAGWYGGIVQVIFGFLGFEQLRRERAIAPAGRFG